MKRTIVTAMVTLVLSLLMSGNLWADDRSGKCGDNITWTLDDNGTLELTGSGPMYDSNGSWWPEEIINRVIISNKITSIGDDAFEDCFGLTRINVLAQNPPECDSETFDGVDEPKDGVDKTKCELVVPDGCVDAYKAASVWADFRNISGFSGIDDVIADDGVSVDVVNGDIVVNGVTDDALVEVIA